MVEGKTDLGTDDTHIGATLPPKGHMATRAHGHSGSVPPSSASCLLVQKGLCTQGNDRTDPGLMEGGRRDQGLTQPGAERTSGKYHPKTDTGAIEKRPGRVLVTFSSHRGTQRQTPVTRRRRGLP